jgi:hypothetical protein
MYLLCILADVTCVIALPCVDAFSDHLDDNARFFTDTRPGQTAPLRSPGGASKLGPLAVDTAMLAFLPPQKG